MLWAAVAGYIRTTGCPFPVSGHVVNIKRSKGSRYTRTNVQTSTVYESGAKKQALFGGYPTGQELGAAGTMPTWNTRYPAPQMDEQEETGPQAGSMLAFDLSRDFSPLTSAPPELGHP